MHPDVTLLEEIPGEELLTSVLQQELSFTLNNKNIKTGKLILFKRVHYHIVLTLQNTKRGTENFEIPIPFKTESCLEDNIFYFDYRIKTFSFKNIDIERRLKNLKIKNVDPSIFYNNILQITIL
jgi:hypothetical protein